MPKLLYISFLFLIGNLVLTLFKGPLEAVAGIVYGLVLGLLWWYLPHSVHVRKIMSLGELFLQTCV